MENIQECKVATVVRFWLACLPGKSKGTFPVWTGSGYSSKKRNLENRKPVLSHLPKWIVFNRKWEWCPKYCTESRKKNHNSSNYGWDGMGRETLWICHKETCQNLSGMIIDSRNPINWTKLLEYSWQSVAQSSPFFHTLVGHPII